MEVENSSAACRASSRGLKVQRRGVASQTVLGQHQPGRAKGIGLDDVHTRLKVSPVDVQHDIRTRAHQVFIATLDCCSAEIRGRETALLEHRPHGAVQHYDAPRE